MTADSEKQWWHGAVVYHIYPRSFYDTNGDGVGDLPGIIEKLDYLAAQPDSLGVNAIWLSPFYASPMADGGYDVADYRAVDPLFGTMADFDRLVKEVHRRGIRLIIDFVPNHTSDKHPWFLESKKSKDNSKRDWYVWRDGSAAEPPNNWLSVFGGSAWEYNQTTKQYYLHSFSKHQPDLNWDNPAVRAEMSRIIDFWFDKGVDGLRVDAVNWLSKDANFEDDPPNPNYQPATDPYHQFLHIHSSWGPRLFEYLSDIVAQGANRGDKFMITEAYPDIVYGVSQQTSYYLQFYKKLDYRYCAPFNFELIGAPWDAGLFSQLIGQFQAALLPGQPSIYSQGNHDKSRLASRIGPEAARTSAVLLLTLPGIPFIYYGDELGMADVPLKSGLRADAAGGTAINRDPERTPMQWSSAAAAGFTTGKPWLPPADNYIHQNVVAEQTDPASYLNLYKQLLRLRLSSDALRFGDYESLDLGRDLLSYKRRHIGEVYLIILNFSSQEKQIESPEINGAVVISSHGDSGSRPLSGRLQLRPHEAVVISVS